MHSRIPKKVVNHHASQVSMKLLMWIIIMNLRVTRAGLKPRARMLTPQMRILPVTMVLSTVMMIWGTVMKMKMISCEAILNQTSLYYY
jgi:hypothetical protein